MEIKKGTLVACDSYGLELGGRILPPNQKRAYGIVQEDNGYENGVHSFTVMLIHPVKLALGMLETDMMPLVQTTTGQKNVIQDNIPDILLALIRKIDGLEKTIKFLQEANKAL
jgi:hypothetical protein